MHHLVRWRSQYSTPVPPIAAIAQGPSFREPLQYWLLSGEKHRHQGVIHDDFDTAVDVRACEVYWFDDTGSGQCRVPASWRILYRAGR